MSSLLDRYIENLPEEKADVREILDILLSKIRALEARVKELEND